MTFTQLLALVQSDGLRICADSRKVQPGDVFVAVCGTQVDGHDYIDRGPSLMERVILSPSEPFRAWIVSSLLIPQRRWVCLLRHRRVIPVPS
ncbi:MAG: Mur ligase domain-containing protein [Planctomycetota bacterium]